MNIMTTFLKRLIIAIDRCLNQNSLISHRSEINSYKKQFVKVCKNCSRFKCHMTSWFSCLEGGMGSQMFFAGSDDICGLNGDNGTIGVGNKSGVGNGVRVSSSISIGSYGGGNGSNGGNAVSGEVSVLSGKNLGGLGGGNGTVSVGNKATMRVTVVSVPCSVVSSPSVPSSISIGISGINTLGSKVSSLSSNDLGGLGGGNGTTGVGDELDSRGSSHAGSEENQKLHV